MIVNIINNISNYKELINSLDIDELSNQDLKDLVSVLQFKNNKYKIKNIDNLRNYKSIKKKYISDSYNNNTLDDNKDNILNMLFNIDLKEAKYIDYKYSHDNNNESMLDKLKNSELPELVYNYLFLINKIVLCDDNKELKNIYDSFKNSNIYDKEIPLEIYLRSVYSKLYSEALYRVEERKKIYGPQDGVHKKVDYNGTSVEVCIPREKFYFLIHCVGSCSLEKDVVDSNYSVDWLDRPQMKDHFIACSFINEMGIFSLRSQGEIIFGFDTLEGGSIMGMGNTDIDSIGIYSESYDGSRELQEGNRDRAKYYVPSHLLSYINDGYNEVVIERRNNDKTRGDNLKRKPDYIIMMAESSDQINFNRMTDLYNSELSFIEEEDRKIIEKTGKTDDLVNFLGKYETVITNIAKEKDVTLKDMVKYYVNLIMKAKYYEDCLKAASEFGIPLVIIDRAYYFDRILNESSGYNEEDKKSIKTLFEQADDYKRREIFNMVVRGEDVIGKFSKKTTKITILT